jgi:exopolysaccharide/PEP-CTERM locus tyrosine autokinase
MTEHSKINRPGAQPRKARSGSLFERADAAYGLEKLAISRVPTNLPEVERRVPQSVRRAASASREPVYEAVVPAPQAQPNIQPGVAERAPERRVTLCGPHQQVDRDVLDFEGLIVPENPVTGLLEEFRIVKRELLADARAGGSDAARRILVCSPHPGEGKTYCAINLAIALAAERDIEVLLVDADVLNPKVPERLGIEADKGLMDCLTDDRLRPEELVIRTDIEGLFVLPAGSGNVRDSEYLASARTAEVLDRLTRGAPNRFVIFDTPPALAASAAAELAAHVGQAMLVVRADQTSRAALEDAQQLLSACPDIKLLLNAARFSPSGRRFGDYGTREQ